MVKPAIIPLQRGSQLLLLLLLLLLLVDYALVGVTAASQDDDAEYCEDVETDRDISTVGEASELRQDVGRCQGIEFNVYWRTSITLGATLELANGTKLRVSGDGVETSIVGGADEIPLFMVSEMSELHVDGLGLTGGYGIDGGAVSAVEGASVTLIDCHVYGNRASQNGGAVYVGGGSTFAAEGVNFTDNTAGIHGGAIHLNHSSKVEISGHSAFVNNSAEDFGGAISAYDGVTITTIGETSFVSNTAHEGGAVYASTDVTAVLSGTQLYENNSARGNGGAIYVTSASPLVSTGQTRFLFNAAPAGFGGAIFSSGVHQVTLKNATLTSNTALCGGGMASFSIAAYDSDNSGVEESPGSSGSTSGAASTSRTSDGDSLSSDSQGSTSDSISSSVPSVKILDSVFEDNYATEDGGALYTESGITMIWGCNFRSNHAASSGGALLHAGGVTEISDTVFAGNGAGKDGSAVLNFGLVSSMNSVTFDSNDFYCEEGKYSTEIDIYTSTGGDACRFMTVCSKCAGACDSELESGVIVVNASSLPACDTVPEGSQTTTRGGTLATLDLLPGYYRSSATSTDIRQCFLAESCRGGQVVGEYCAEGYAGPYCAVCTAGYSPGYSYYCRSCVGDNKQIAIWIPAVIGVLALLSVIFFVVKLISVAEMDEGNPQLHSSWGRQERFSRRQLRATKTVPLAAVKIFVVVWQIIAQYFDATGVRYPGVHDDLLSVVNLFNLDLGFILSFACVYDANFYERLLMATICPVAVLGFLGCTYLVARRRNPDSQEATRIIKHRHVSAALTFMIVVYATVSNTIFETFACDVLDDGTSYLRADYTLVCTTPAHVAYRIYAGLMIVVYPVGFPTVVGWWLFKNRHELQQQNRMSKAKLSPLASLWEPYKQEVYYYEVVECCRRIAISGCAIFVYPDSSTEVAIILLLATAFMVGSEVLSPLSRTFEMWLYRSGHYIVCASIYLSLLLRVDVYTSPEVFSWIIIIAFSAMLLVVVVHVLMSFASYGKGETTGEVSTEVPTGDDGQGVTIAFRGEGIPSRRDENKIHEEEKSETWDRPTLGNTQRKIFPRRTRSSAVHHSSSSEAATEECGASFVPSPDKGKTGAGGEEWYDGASQVPISRRVLHPGGRAAPSRASPVHRDTAAGSVVDSREMLRKVSAARENSQDEIDEQSTRSRQPESLTSWKGEHLVLVSDTPTKPPTIGGARSDTDLRGVDLDGATIGSGGVCLTTTPRSNTRSGKYYSYQKDNDNAAMGTGTMEHHDNNSTTSYSSSTSKGPGTGYDRAPLPGSSSFGGKSGRSIIKMNASPATAAAATPTRLVSRDTGNPEGCHPTTSNFYRRDEQSSMNQEQRQTQTRRGRLVKHGRGDGRREGKLAVAPYSTSNPRPITVTAITSSGDVDDGGERATRIRTWSPRPTDGHRPSTQKLFLSPADSSARSESSLCGAPSATATTPVGLQVVFEANVPSQSKRGVGVEGGVGVGTDAGEIRKKGIQPRYAQHFPSSGLSGSRARRDDNEPQSGETAAPSAVTTSKNKDINLDQRDRSLVPPHTRVPHPAGTAKKGTAISGGGSGGGVEKGQDLDGTAKEGPRQGSHAGDSAV